MPLMRISLMKGMREGFGKSIGEIVLSVDGRYDQRAAKG
jgi:hypothetical protein